MNSKKETETKIEEENTTTAEREAKIDDTLRRRPRQTSQPRKGKILAEKTNIPSALHSQ